MSNRRYSIPCTIIRGGTSKGVFILDEHLPKAESERNRILLRIMGSPDTKQIDGLGGATSVTSKVAVISKSMRDDADIDYSFFQVGIDKPIVSTQGNCGNISAGVGVFAIEKGLVQAQDPITTVRVFNTNTKKIIIEEVECINGRVRYSGDYSISGVPGSASPIKLRFLNPVGTLNVGTNQNTQLFPTGNRVDIIEMPDHKKIEATIIDAVNPTVFIKANSIGMHGSETVIDEAMSELIETIRGISANKLGLCRDPNLSSRISPGIPKIIIVAQPDEYISSEGETIKAERIDILGRMMSMQKLHPTFALTGALSTAVASIVPGTIISKMIDNRKKENAIFIGHPGGIISAEVAYREEKGTYIIDEVIGFRTANLLLDGIVYVD